MNTDDFASNTGLGDSRSGAGSTESFGGSLAGAGTPDSLGSLAQSARRKQLNTARWILIVFGCLQFAYSAFFVIGAERLVKEKFEKEIQQLQRQRMVIDKNKVAELQHSAIQQTRLMNSGGAVVGISMVIFGIIVFKYPVLSTVTSLILYIGLQVVVGFWLYLDSGQVTQFFEGLLIKVIIVAALVKAIQAGIAYEKEQSNARLSPEMVGGVSEF